MEDKFVQILRLIHIAAGFTALVIAPLAMVAKKGGDQHRRWGKIFFYSMAVVAFTAVVISFYNPNIFLTIVAVFSFHMVASGYRALYLKRLHEGQKAAQWDIILQGTAGVVNGGLFIWGIVHLLLGHRGMGPILYIVLGAVGSFMVWRNIQRFFKRSHEKHEWLFEHMIGFLGGYIATVSAFSVVNMEFITPGWLQWLWPTILGTPMIILWTKYYRQRLSKGRRARDVVDIRIR